MLIVGLLLTAITTSYVAVMSRNKDQLRFENQVQQIHDSIEARLEIYISVLRGARGLFAADENISRAAFHDYVAQLNLQQHYPGIQGVGFSRRIQPATAAALVTAMQQQGLPGFHIWPQYPRPEYHSILYLEPLERRNQAALGYDMFTEPTRRAAMQEACDTGLPAATGRVTLVQEIDSHKQADFLIYLPLYQHGHIPANTTERRAELMGFIYSPFRVEDLLQGIFGSQTHPRIAFQIFDSKELSGDHLLYRSTLSAVENDNNYRPRFATLSTLNVAGRNWSLQCVTRPEFDGTASFNLAPFTCLSGLLMSGLLFTLSLVQAKARKHAERSTAELRRSEMALRHSEQELADLFENATLGIHWIGPDGIVLRANRAELEMLGYSREEFIGHHIVRFHADQDTLRDILDRACRGENLYDYEARLRCKDGTIRYVQMNSSSYWENNDLVHICFFMHDITDRKKAQEVRSELAAIVESTDDAIIGETLDGIVTSWNAGAAKTFGYAVAEIVGQPIMMLAPPGLNDELSDFLNRIKRGEHIYNVETVRRRKDGSLLDVSLTLSPIQDQHGQVVGVSTIARDISERKKTETERNELLEREQAARSEAEQASRIKDEFLAVLSHELRTPLTAILGWASLLQRGTMGAEDMLRGLQIIERNARAQTQLIEDLLDVSRIIAGKLRMESKVVDLPAVIEAALESVRPAAAAKHIELSQSIDPQATSMQGDAHRLQQIIANLLSNAVKFTPEGGQVRIFLERVNHHVQIIVRDNGQGIPAEFLPHVFERFQQADSSTTRRYGGLGLGLGIVRQLVELHGGSVRATSEGEGRGSTFTVTLPVSPAYANQAPAEMPPAASQDQNGQAALPASALKGVNILVVDDDPDTCEVIRRILEGNAAFVITAYSSPEALNMLQQHKPDILISDIGMPGEDGYTLIQRIRALPDGLGHDLPAVALTAFARSEDQTRALNSGFQQHLAKPVDPAELVATIVPLVNRANIIQPELA